ncbi:hypothetical protein BJ138DRAFT_1155145 [Hygrophoropsis aurantiaca]|uniref:Uncharacterized protein n=1 Tax=Hygrophoropsis aurantiaca TaxID=72124 RepID=A0ACB8A8T4_9AGAM|nr:hypothetical protein BJ138DRAFT_1155145 [Hygrophoropsis aurantiaca]
MAVSESATPRRSISIPHMHLNLLSGSNSQSQQRRPSEPQIPSTFSNSNPTINVNPTPSTISTATSSFRSLRNFLPFGPSSSTSSNAQKGTNAHASLGVSSVSSSSLHAPSTSSAKQLPSPFASLRRSFTSERKNSASFVRPRASTSVDEDGPVIAIEAEPSPHYGDRCDELGMRTDTGYEDHARDPREERNREERITRSAPDLFHSSTQDSILRRNGSTNSTNIGNKRDLIAASLHSSPNAGVTANTSLTADLSTILEAENSGMSISISKHIPFLEDEGENERSPLREDDDEDEKDIAERSFLGGLRSSRVNYPSSSPLPSSSRSPLLSSSRSPVHSPIPLAHSPRFSPLSSPQNHHRLLPAPSRSPLSSPSRSPVLSSTPHSRSPLPSPHPHTHSHPHARHLFANLPLPSLHPHLHSHPELTTTPSPDPLDVSTSQLTAQVLDALRPRAQPDLPVERRDGYNVRGKLLFLGTRSCAYIKFYFESHWFRLLLIFETVFI